MAVLLTPPALQFLDDNGNPLSGGKVYTYVAGTTTPKATYTNSGGGTAHANPVVLDSAGRPPGGSIWLIGSYKVTVTDADDVTVTTTDNVTAFTVSSGSSDAYFESFSGNGVTVEFSLSEDLGTDENTVLVFVNDEAGAAGYEVQNPSAFTLDGNSITFDTAPPSGTNNIYIWAPSLLVSAAAVAAAAAQAAADSTELSAAACAQSVIDCQTIVSAVTTITDNQPPYFYALMAQIFS